MPEMKLDTGTSLDAPGGTDAGYRSARRKSLFSLVFGIGLPIVVYYGLTALGLGDGPALGVAAGAVAVSLLPKAVRERRLDGLGMVVLATCLISLALALLSGNERIILAKDPATSGLAGLAFLATCVVGRPATFHFSRRLRAFTPEQRAHWDRLWATEAHFRSLHRTSSAVWGAVLFGESVLRMVLVFTLPPSVMVGLSTVIELVAVALAIAWTLWHRRRHGGAQLETRMARPAQA
ncbi:VC0807 family protein [Kutzneria kofuensis]|uniref:Intracellular septation protein A n=1 Tax=Kutzneria kofuensis TaxID=103725 RepID=A0A7W9KCB8_9PSEU|nr:VC0807 family protein [Kutzneria kofuensis]MBB5889967.1 hypothetical protein [Kutzneria kofuensis]